MMSIVAQQSADGSRDEVQAEHTRWIQNVLRSVDLIKPGMTRKSLSRCFEEDGGSQFREHGRYAYKHCAYIKIDIEFAPADQEVDFSPDDKVVKVSRPYLEYPVSD